MALLLVFLGILFWFHRFYPQYLLMKNWHQKQGVLLLGSSVCRFEL